MVSTEGPGDEVTSAGLVVGRWQVQPRAGQVVSFDGQVSVRDDVLDHLLLSSGDAADDFFEVSTFFRARLSGGLCQGPTQPCCEQVDDEGRRFHVVHGSRDRERLLS